MTRLIAYTRSFADEYGAAMHLALEENGVFTVLNKGFGVLFAKAVFSDESFDGASRGLVQPWLFRSEKGYGVVALRRSFAEKGVAEPDEACNSVMYFTSPDLLSYREEHMLALAPQGVAVQDVCCMLAEGEYHLDALYDGAWHRFSGNSMDRLSEQGIVAEVQPRIATSLWDAEPACALSLQPSEVERLRRRWISPALPECTPRFPFPLMPPRGDPMAIPYRDGYLYMATDDEGGQRALKIRFAKTIAQIPSAPDHTILQATPSGDMSCCLWAPELHWVGQRLCIFFAAGVSAWYTVQSRVMWLVGDDPLRADCWSAPARVVRADGRPLTDDGITLDMTVARSTRGLYVIWSERPIRLSPFQSGTADLRIARLNEEEPWRLSSAPVTLSRPEYGWERIHSPVNEGAFVLKHDGRLFVTYAAALIDHTYAVGLLTARDDAELTDPSVWEKCNYPVLHRLSLPDQLGAGHNSFVRDELGNDIMMIHALDMRAYLRSADDWRRYPCFRTVVWDADGFPHLDAQPKEVSV